MDKRNEETERETCPRQKSLYSRDDGDQCWWCDREAFPVSSGQMPFLLTSRESLPPTEYINMARDRERPRTADGYYSIDDRTPLLPPPYPSSTCPSRPTTAAAPTTQATPKLYPYRERRSICARCLLIVFSLVVIFTIVIIGFWLGYNWKDPNSECSDYITQYCKSPLPMHCIEMS